MGSQDTEGRWKWKIARNVAALAAILKVVTPEERREWKHAQSDTDLPPDDRVSPRAASDEAVVWIEPVADDASDNEQERQRAGTEGQPEGLPHPTAGAAVQEPCPRHSGGENR